MHEDTKDSDIGTEIPNPVCWVSLLLCASSPLGPSHTWTALLLDGSAGVGTSTRYSGSRYWGPAPLGL